MVFKVKVIDLHKLDSLSDKDVLIVASDGLWNVLSNEDVAKIVKSALANTDSSIHLKYFLLYLILFSYAKIFIVIELERKR